MPVCVLFRVRVAPGSLGESASGVRRPSGGPHKTRTRTHSARAALAPPCRTQALEQKPVRAPAPRPRRTRAHAGCPMARLVFPQPPDADDYDGERRWRKDCKRETVEARHLHLVKIGPALGELEALRHLDVGDNEIEGFDRSDHAAMETLSIYSNRLTSLDSLPRFENLRFLGVGYNSIEALPRALGERCPLLECFDGAYNALASLDVTVDALGGCMHLKQCVLTGNPCALLPNYRKRVAFGLPQLARLDDMEVLSLIHI